MGAMISYIIGALFIIFPTFFSPIIANIVYQLTRHKPGGHFTKSAQEIYSEASEDQMKVRPFFTVFIGLFIITLTFIIQTIKG